MDTDKERVKKICEDYDKLNQEGKREVIGYICRTDYQIFSVVPRNNLRIQENPFRKEARDY